MSKLLLLATSTLVTFFLGLTLWDHTAPVALSVAPKLAEADVFPHGKHVHEEWLTSPEVKRDCRGCHDFDESDGVRQPEQTCVLCHYDFGSGLESLKVEGSIEALPSTIEAFAHGDHGKLDCKACHAPPESALRGIGGPIVPNQMFIPQGLGSCIKCHDPSAKNRPANRSKDDVGFQTVINEKPRMKANPDAVFKHSEHLSPAEINRQQNCNTCHDTLAGAGPNMGDAVFNSASCGECHQDKSGVKLEFGTEVRKYTSPSDLAFYHSDHVTPEAMGKSQELKAQGCFACHDKHEGNEGRGVSDYPLKRGFDKYQQCSICHAESDVKWRGFDHQSSPADVTWRIPDHGVLSKQGNNCTACHVFGQEAAMKTTRPMSEVGRSRPSVFEIVEQAHPHITGSNDTKNKDCKSCHIAEAKVIPSRIKEKRFAHDAHLGASPTAKDCQTCHVSPQDGTKNLMQLAGHGGMQLSYSEASCNECHQGVALVKAGTYTKQISKNVLFDHNDHVTAKSDPTVCNDCHVRGDGGEFREFVFQDGVKDCSQCHDHGEKNFKNTGNKNQAYVNGCVACHEVHVKGVPALNSELPASRVDIHAIKGSQFHPLPSKMACSQCHRPGFTQDKLVESQFDVVKSEFVNYQRGQGKEESFHGAHSSAGDVFPQECYACHWNNFTKIQRTVLRVADELGKARTIGRSQPHSNPKKASVIRRALGNMIKGYPGRLSK